ncbi:MAG: cyclic nucleotide-binding domain-containing protein, partial [Hyphomicrobiaceae bacterium]
VVGALPGILTMVAVTLISVVVKYATLELTRGDTIDLDREVLAHGMGSLATALLGGMFAGVSMSMTRLAQQAGASGFGFAAASALATAGFLLTGTDVLRLVPVPVLAGLLIFLGFGLIADGLMPPLRQRAWLELAIALAILLACVQQGYVIGVLTGLAASCLIFVLSYARVDSVRRHATGDVLLARTARGPEVGERLRDAARAVHVFSLAGYQFFGSAEQALERVRSVLDAPAEPPARIVVLDFTDVPGADASARAGIARLKNYCDRRGATVVLAGLAPGLLAALTRTGVVVAGAEHSHFPDLPKALAWCETQLLAEIGQDDAVGSAGFRSWLAREVGGEKAADVLIGYLGREELPAGTVIYRAGEPSDSIGFVAAGSVEVQVPGPGPGGGFDRRMMGSTVIGEMGYFRRRERGATVVAETDTVLYVIERHRLRDLELAQPYLAAAIYRLVIRELADRLDTANVEASLRR